MRETWVLNEGSGEPPNGAREFVDVDWMNGLQSQDLMSAHLDWGIKFMWRNKRVHSALKSHKQNG